MNSHHPHPTFISSEQSCARFTSFTASVNGEMSAHLLMEEHIWWLRLTCQFSTRLNFAKSIKPMATAHMVWDASSFTIFLNKVNNKFKRPRRCKNNTSIKINTNTNIRTNIKSKLPQWIQWLLNSSQPFQLKSQSRHQLKLKKKSNTFLRLLNQL